ncbi:MAG: AraC family transcriptional regulator [Terrimicrobiaceae bacterium]
MRTIYFKDLNAAPFRPHIALTRLTSRQVSARHTHDFHEVFLITSGSGIHHINSSKVELSAGHLVAILPKDRHQFSSHRGEELAILNVAIPSPWWKQFHLLMGSSLPQNWFRSGSPAGHVLLGPKAMRNIQTSFEQLASRDNLPPSDLVEALLRVAGLFLPEDRPAALLPPPWLEQWKHTMMNAGESVSEPLPYWQKQSGRSPEHLARSCRTFYQCTPTDLLNHARIERAKALLGSTDDKVISIGFACGFGNLSNFYRNFLARTGVTPTGWRRRSAATVPLGSE